MLIVALSFQTATNALLADLAKRIQKLVFTKVASGRERIKPLYSPLSAPAVAMEFGASAEDVRVIGA
jgi:hypothetical protein